MNKEIDISEVVNLITHIRRMYTNKKAAIQAGTHEGDAYKQIASAAFDIDEEAVTKKHRDFVKSVLFSEVYGLSPATLREHLPGAQQEVRREDHGGEQW